MMFDNFLFSFFMKFFKEQRRISNQLRPLDLLVVLVVHGGQESPERLCGSITIISILKFYQKMMKYFISFPQTEQTTGKV